VGVWGDGIGFWGLDRLGRLEGGLKGGGGESRQRLNAVYIHTYIYVYDNDIYTYIWTYRMDVVDRVGGGGLCGADDEVDQHLEEAVVVVCFVWVCFVCVWVWV
jgi:hypothetical protein